MEVKNLILALSKVQAELRTIGRNETADVTTKTGAAFTYKYVTLDKVWDNIRGLLQKTGLVVVQLPISEGEKIGVETILYHTSGESMSSKVLFTLTKNDAQGGGSAITYARRYALCSMLGITVADEDDDGNLASKPINKPTEQSKEKPTEPTEPVKPDLSKDVSFDDLMECEIGNTLKSVIGIYKSNKVRNVKTKKGDMKKVTDYIIADNENNTITISIWGEPVEFAVDTVLNFVNVKIGEYRDRIYYTAEKVEVNIPF